MKKILLYLIASLVTCGGYAQSEVIVPPFEDKYSQYVEQLEAGSTEVDYRDFRFSFLESEQFKIASAQEKTINTLWTEIDESMQASDYQKVISLAKQILSIDYTNTKAHKIVGETHDVIDDALNARKYQNIETGLLKSIVANRDGKSCVTGWVVTQVSEESRILEILGVEVKKQSIVNTDGRICDEFEVVDEGTLKKILLRFNEDF